MGGALSRLRLALVSELRFVPGALRAPPVELRSNPPIISTRELALRWIGSYSLIVADGRGFEPRVPFGTHAFQACTIDRSVTHPLIFLFLFRFRLILVR
jgi:hypothetical protein